MNKDNKESPESIPFGETGRAGDGFRGLLVSRTVRKLGK